ncbi:bifunctional diaminohydroxyphosphoribosylaminopyrimidine deaminase/5-amino-6-(5-phosphoribosylamino)uracil reductase RibD, partial [Candidatus Micrarchaeota archaeon]|nr:bifunctional diaminohydroxyphosphoribosylaminopyrimidine deaminase/5-amino-6-(5-phosphoribosylamino)uracil reductase RibD [Candidatus Micrarchaeota archaeon]
MSKKDNQYMSIAIELAKKGNAHPNPKVGAVIVKNGKIIGKGYHRKAGKPHGEIEAIKSVKDKRKLRGSVLYLNLEPCSHYGKTPPCVNKIIEAGIKEVVFSMNDPNPKVNGNGEKIMEKNRIKIRKGIMESEAEELNKEFIKHMKTGIPYVSLKTGMTLDGKIATETGDSKWITSEKSRRKGYKLRSQNDAVLVGIGTVLKDNPGLNGTEEFNPVKIILDGRLRIPLDSKLLKKGKTIIATAGKGKKEKRKKLEKKGCEIIEAGKKRVDLKKLLKKLGKKGITSVLVEGGSEINGSFLKENLVDRFYFFIAPKILWGNNQKSVFGGVGPLKIKNCRKIRIESIEKIGDE